MLDIRFHVRFTFSSYKETPWFAVIHTADQNTKIENTKVLNQV